jgi:drug/metabolite transporter (DMT)-like permease
VATTNRSRLELVAGAALFSTAGAAIKACALTSWQVASFRAAIAALAVLLLVPTVRRGLSARAALVGVAYAVTVVLFVQANKLTTAASTIFLEATSPLYIVLLQPLLLKERVPGRDLAALVALALGLGLVLLGVPDAGPTAPDPRLGNLLAAVSGCTCAFMMVGLRWLARDTDEVSGAPAAVVLGNLFAFGATLPLSLPVAHARPADWALVVYLGVFQIGVAYTLFTLGLRRGVRSLDAALVGFIEPLSNPVWVYLFIGERPSAWAILGGAIIIAAVVAHTFLSASKKAKGKRQK